MNIYNYKTLISNLPVRQQGFTTKRTTWLKAENEFAWFEKLNDKLFGENPTLSVCRQDIFDSADFREIIIKTVYWGYTGGMRGNNFINILRNIDPIENSFRKLKLTHSPTTRDFLSLTIKFKSLSGLGLSTYSKLLYFFQISFNDNPCLILDQRLIDVFASKTYLEFNQLSGISYGNAESKYLDYLYLTNQIAKRLETKGENIEQFLFIFGNNLKPISRI